LGQVEKLTDEALFERFFGDVTGEEMADEQRSTLHELLGEARGSRS